MIAPAPIHPEILPIIVLGPGRVGLSLSVAAQKSGLPLASILTPPGETDIGPARDRLMPATHIQPICSWSPPDNPHLMILTVPDDAILSAASSLLEKGCGYPGWTILHTSGVHTSEPLTGLQKTGAHVGSWHPMQTFPEPDPGRFRDIPVVMEGDEIACRQGEILAKSLGARPVLISPESKVLYHTLCTMASSHTAAILLFCHDSLPTLALEDHELLWDGFLRLGLSTLRNMSCSSPAEAITGPVVRQDWKTVDAHQQTLENLAPDWARIYEKISLFLRNEIHGVSPDSPASDE